MDKKGMSNMSIWLENQFSFTDNKNMQDFPGAEIRLSRMVFFKKNNSEQAIQNEARFLYPEYRNMIAMNHFSSVKDPEIHKLVTMCIFVILIYIKTFICIKRLILLSINLLNLAMKL